MTKVAFRPGWSILKLLDRDEWWLAQDFVNWTTAVTGSGVVTKAVHRAFTQTGSTAPSTALIRTGDRLGLNAGSSRLTTNWSKKIVIHVFISHAAATANGVSRLTMGKLTSSGVGALADKGIGIQIDDDALKGIVHDGTSGNTIDLSTTVTSTVTRVTIVSDGAGNVEWFVSGVSKGTSSDGPTGNSTNDAVIIQMESDNGGDGANQQTAMYSVKVYVEQ